MIGKVILITAIVGISAFTAILLIDNANTQAKIKQIENESAEMMSCEVWNTELHQCASDALTHLYLSRNQAN